jgi:hypothetical protein
MDGLSLKDHSAALGLSSRFRALVEALFMGVNRFINQPERNFKPLPTAATAATEQPKQQFSFSPGTRLYRPDQSQHARHQARQLRVGERCGWCFAHCRAPQNPSSCNKKRTHGTILPDLGQ